MHIYIRAQVQHRKSVWYKLGAQDAVRDMARLRMRNVGDK